MIRRREVKFSKILQAEPKYMRAQVYDGLFAQVPFPGSSTLPQFNYTVGEEG